ncbi:unnamed protein product [Victoria cruziana]
MEGAPTCTRPPTALCPHGLSTGDCDRPPSDRWRVEGRRIKASAGEIRATGACLFSERQTPPGRVVGVPMCSVVRIPTKLSAFEGLSDRAGREEVDDRRKSAPVRYTGRFLRAISAAGTAEFLKAGAEVGNRR